MKNKIKFKVIIFFFASSTLWGQKNIDYNKVLDNIDFCKVLEQALTKSFIPNYYMFYYYDTVFIYEENIYKYFTNCEFSHIKTNNKIVIIPYFIPPRTDTLFWMDSIDRNGNKVSYISNLDSFDAIKINENYKRTENPQIGLWQRNFVLGISVRIINENTIKIFFDIGRYSDSSSLRKGSSMVYKKRRRRYVLIESFIN